MRKSSTIATILGVMVVVLGCGEPDARFGATAAMPAPAAPATVPVPTPPRGPSTDYVVPEPQLRHLGLETFWSGKLPVTPAANVIDAYVLGDFILCESADKRLYAVDRMTGVPKWTVDLPNRCDFRGCDDGGEHLFVPCRNVLVAIDKRGIVEWRNYLEFAPGGIPVADGDRVYLPCFDGRIRAFLKEGGYFSAQYTTGNAVEAKPGLGSRLVYAGSTDGTIYALNADKLDPSWTFKTYGAIRAGVITEKMRVFVASTDGSLYYLNGLPQASREQQLAWNRAYASGASIEKTPFLAPEMILVVNTVRECHAVDRESGRKLWMLADVDEVLMQGKVNTYLLRHGTKIVAVDNKTGAVRWLLDTPVNAFAYYLVNPADDVLYMVKTTGETQAVRELRPAGAGAPEPEKPAPKKIDVDAIVE